MISVGIDIGSYSIKVAQIEGSAKGYSILRLEEYPLTQDPTKDNSIDVLEALRDIKTRFIPDGTQVIISAKQNHISFRRRLFPFKERHKILRSLPFELEDDIPLSIENALFEAKITRYVGEAADVLAAICPKEHIVEQLKAFDDAGIYPNIMSPEGIAISNIFERWSESPPVATVDESTGETGKTEAFLHIGHRVSVCSILQNGTIIDAFAIDWGGSDIAELITIKYNLQYVEALKELRKKGFILTTDEGASKEQVAFSDVIKSSVDQLATPMRLSLIEAESALKTKVTSIVLSGGTSLLKNIGPYLTQKLEVASNRMNSLDRFPDINFGNSPNNEISYIIAIGLAAEGLRRPKNPAVNMLKGDFAPQNQSMKIFWETWSPTINLTAILFVIFFAWAFVREMTAMDVSGEADSKLRVQAKNVAGLSGPQGSRRNIRKYIREQEQKVKQREVLENLQEINSAVDILQRASLLFPPKEAGKIKVTQFTVKNDRVQIIGEVDQPNLIPQIQTSLKSLSANNKVESAPPTKTVNKAFRGFNFSFPVARRAGG